MTEYILEQVGMVYFNDDENDLFGMEIKYQEGLYPLGQTYGCYNGNISGIEWRTGGTNDDKRGYGYHYDGLNRLTQASYGVNSGTSWNVDLDRYSVSNLSYDRNGNILSISRQGLTAVDPVQAFGSIDNLAYSYLGNQLIGVNDQVDDLDGMPDFKDNGYEDVIDPQDNGTWEYQYDANGSMILDLNKGISVSYDENNLPKDIVFSISGVDGPTADRLRFYYDPSGRKLRKEVISQEAVQSIIDYLGSFQFEDGELKLIFTDEGRMIETGGSWQYEYFLKDHLGSPRVVIQASETEGEAEIAQIDHYYPFGMTLGGLSETYSIPNNYLYNGKEDQTEFGLGWADYGARMYDPQLGRWHSVDPLAEQRSWLSPYSYCQNNPIIRTDPTGALDWIPPSDGSGNWTAQAGDSPGSLATQAGISQSEAEAAVRSANQARGQARTSETMVYKDDVVNVGSSPGDTWSSRSSTTNSFTPTTPSPPFAAATTSGSSGNPVQAVSNVNNATGIVITAVQGIVQNTQIGANFAYAISGNSKAVSAVSNTFKYAPYVGLFVTVGTGTYLSIQKDPATGRPYHSWLETGTDIGANLGIIYIGAKYGGWWGAGAATFYVGLKYSSQETMKCYIENGINPGMQVIIFKE